MREQKQRMELCLSIDDAPAESLWARIRGQNNVSDATVTAYEKPPSQEEVEETFR